MNKEIDKISMNNMMKDEQIMALTNRLNKIEQYSRNKNIEICNISGNCII